MRIERLIDCAALLVVASLMPSSSRTANDLGEMSLEASMYVVAQGGVSQVTLDGAPLETIIGDIDDWVTPPVDWIQGTVATFRRLPTATTPEIRLSQGGAVIDWMGINDTMSSTTYTWPIPVTINGVRSPANTKTDSWGWWRERFPAGDTAGSQPQALGTARFWNECIVAQASHMSCILPVWYQAFEDFFVETDVRFRVNDTPGNDATWTEMWLANEVAAGDRLPRFDGPARVYAGQWLIIEDSPDPDIEDVIAGVMVDLPGSAARYTDVPGLQRVLPDGNLLVAGQGFENYNNFLTLVRVVNDNDATTSHFGYGIDWSWEHEQTIGSFLPAPTTVLYMRGFTSTQGNMGVAPPVQDWVDTYNTANGRDPCDFMGGDRERLTP
jgi:hypothetical protein